jgi:hypothetical protein
MGSSQSVAIATSEEIAGLADRTKVGYIMKTFNAQMTHFCGNLRRIYATPNLKDKIKVTDEKILEDLRLIALFYSVKVLPVAETVVVNVYTYLDNYLYLDFEALDFITEVEGYVTVCLFLAQMHQALMTALKKQQDDISSGGQLTVASEELKDTVACTGRLLYCVSVFQAFFHLTYSNLGPLVQQIKKAANRSGLTKIFFEKMKKCTEDGNFQIVRDTLRCSAGEVSM